MGCGTNAVHVTGEQNAEGLIKETASQQKTRTFTVFRDKTSAQLFRHIYVEQKLNSCLIFWYSLGRKDTSLSLMPFVTLSLQSASVRRWHLWWRLRECHVVTLSSRTQGRKQCAINTSQSAVLCFQDIHMETFYLVLN